MHASDMGYVVVSLQELPQCFFYFACVNNQMLVFALIMNCIQPRGLKISTKLLMKNIEN